MNHCRWLDLLKKFVGISIVLLVDDIKASHAAPGVHENCNTWSSWVNEHKPSLSDKTDYEHVLPSEQAAFCPAVTGGTVTKVQCKDDKGEPFSGTAVNGILKFNVFCNLESVSVSCELTDTVAGSCPDFSLSYYCYCTANSQVQARSTTLNSYTQTNDRKTTTGSRPSISPKKEPIQLSTERITITSEMSTSLNEGSTADLSMSSNAKLTNTQGDTVSTGRTTTSVWWIVAIACVILFLLNVILTVCLYKKAMRTKSKRRTTTAVQPMATP